ncbi:armadillo repeat-containing protein 7 isoform X2 [Rattus rattus]|uniref:armadillo repeat-containing protein 7 isoform X2 n=1 Tax=Rattus rattus TaxID=10117 RepID=UPI0013F2EA00|nr:armadillo repeat-containing protein 7 isoform X2 [Rattus rattus]
MAQKPKIDPHVGRLGYLQALVTEFQETESQDAKEQVLANLANFAYDPGNYQYLRQLQVLDLFLDSLSEENETLIKFAIDPPPQVLPSEKSRPPRDVNQTPHIPSYQGWTGQPGRSNRDRPAPIAGTPQEHQGTQA